MSRNCLGNIGLGVVGRVGASETPTEASPSIRFGISADAHLLGPDLPEAEPFFRNFVAAMKEWSPDFVIDLGDWVCPSAEGLSPEESHLVHQGGLIHHRGIWDRFPGPHYHVIGNHDVGWLRGGNEVLASADLYVDTRNWEALTKDEFLARTQMPHRYYSFDLKGFHFIVLDGNNARDETAPPPGRDGAEGPYFIDGPQKEWLRADLAAHRNQSKIVFCHAELHHTPAEGSGEGGEVPFPGAAPNGAHVDNGWELREMFTADGKVRACFSGHKHLSRWTVYGGVHYLTLAATHREGSYAQVTLAEQLHIEGVGQQRNYTLSLD